MTRSRSLLIACAVVALTGSTCGNPDPHERKFSFTPVPYTVVTFSGTPVPIAVDQSDGSRFAADKVLVQIKRDRLERFREWANDLGFEVFVSIEDSRTPDGSWRGVSVIGVVVPAGGAPDALELIKKQDVISAELAYFLEPQG